MLKLDFANIKSALVYGVLTAILMMALYAVSVNDVFALNMKELTNAGVFGFLTVIVSLIKNLLTTDSGKFLNVIEVIPDKTA